MRPLYARHAAMVAAILALSVTALGQAGRPGQPRPGLMGPGQMLGGGPFMPSVTPMDPALGKLTMQIMALRQLHDAGFAAKDLATAVPVLKEMETGEKALRERSEKALQRELQALLAAGPDDNPPRGSGEALQEAGMEHQRNTSRQWERLTEAIGDRKVDCLRRLLGAAPPPGWFPNMPGVGPGMGIGPGTPGGGPDPRGGQGAPPRGPEPEPGNMPMADFASADEWPGPMPEAQAPQGPAPPLQGRRRPGQGGQGGPQPPGFFPGQTGFPGGPGNMPFMQPIGPRLSLGELVDLMEQKLAAMRK